MRLVVNYLDDPRVLEVQDVSGDATLRDLVVRSHGVAPQEDETLWVDEVPQRGDHLLSELVLLDGTTIGTAPPTAPQPLTGWSLTALQGNGVGARALVGASGPTTIGRSPEADLTVDSPSVSWLHATAAVEEDGSLRLCDQGSTNGSSVEGAGLDEEGTCVTHDCVLRVGGGVVEVRRDVQEPPAPRPGSLHNVTSAGTAPFNRPPRPVLPRTDDPVEAPARKVVSPATRFSLITVLAPLALAVVMIVMMGNLRYALVSAMSPVLALGNWVEQRRRRRVESREADASFEKDLEAFRRTVSEAAEAELAARRVQTPAVDLVVRRAQVPTTTVWQRRHDDPDALLLSAGVGDSPWAPPLERRSGPRTDDAVRVVLESSRIAAGPAQVDLTGGGVVGIVGVRDTAVAVARSLLVQAAVHCGPADLTVGVFHDQGREAQWAWAQWLPHTRRLGAGDEGRWYGGRRAVSDGLLRGLRDGVEQLPTPQLLLVLDSDVLTEGRESPARSLLGRGRLARAEHGRAPRRVSGVVLAASREQLPASCTTVIEVREDSEGDIEVLGGTGSPEAVCLVGLGVDDARTAAMALARLEDPELEVPGASLPALVRLSPLLGLEEVSAEEVRRSWRTPGVSTPVGVGEHGPLVLDLVRDGPHGLVGGTTGSGKSEFLRSLVAGLAARNDPTRLTFILIDFKGGAAFATCERLPHTIGTISNLDAQMADRALRALEAEMTYRQRLFAEAGEGVDNLDAYLATGPRQPMPRLLLVVDEFAMLAKEYPDVLSSLVSVAAVGRTLGVHMVLATQRPAGVVNDDILANTNLRVALRVQSREDSSNVIGVPDASGIGRQQKGRALVKLGQDDITPVQTALVTGAVEEQEREPVTARLLTGDEPGAGGPASPSPARRPAAGDPETDLDVLIDAIVEANRQEGFAPPRPVWPEPLGARVALRGVVGQDGDGALPEVGGRSGDVLVFGLSDDPDRQRQVPEGWDLAEGNLLLGGVPGSGTTTALASIALTAASTTSPEELDLVVLDLGANELAPLEALPHTLAFAGTGGSSRERQSRLLKYLRSELDRRRAVPGPHRTTVVLVDGLAALRDEYQDQDGLPLLEGFYRVYADGPEVGIHCAVTTSRVKAVPSAIDEVTTQRWLFRLADRYDYASCGLKPAEAPPPVPGRAVVARSHLQTHVATPGCDLGSAVAHVARTLWSGWVPKVSVVGELPSLVAVGELGAAAVVLGEPWCLPVGVRESDLSPAVLESYEGEHVLVAGPPRSGKSSTLLALAQAARQAADGGGDVYVAGVASRRSPLLGADLDEVVTQPSDVGALVAGLRLRSGPVLLLVDDAERFDDADKSITDLLTAGLPGLRVAAAGRADDLRGLYNHWTKTLRRSRCGIVLQPNVDLDGDLLSVRVPRRPPVPMTVGRGYLCLNGSATLIQTAVPR